MMKDGFRIDSGDELVRIEKYFWLPRLNQLIEIAQCDNRAFCDISFKFLDWLKLPYENSTPANKIFTSIEQMWLVYIMKTRFGKKWIQNNWLSST